MGKKVIIIDDDADARLFYSSILIDLELDIKEAKDGEEGIQKIKSEKPDLILLDLMMPKKGGLAVFNEIMDNPESKNIPVIIISGATSVTGVDMKHYVYNRPFQERKEKVIEKTVESCPVEYLEKPVQPEALLNLVKRILAL
jgi:CheY-like chemotaxis protein